MTIRLSRNCTLSEWRAWEVENAAARHRGGHDDGTVRISLELDGLSLNRYLVPAVKVGGVSGMSTDSRVARSQLRRSIANLDAVEDLYATIEGTRVYVEGECPCDSCSGRGTQGSSPCDRCDGKGVR